jgi:hypothetical protein
MSNLYSYKGAYPYPLPTDMSGYNFEDFTLAPAEPTLIPGQVLGWVDLAWVVREANEAEMQIQWVLVRTIRNSLLEASDVLVIRAYEAALAVPVDIVAYRQALRDVTNQINPFEITWPSK